jgi:hypothetical protein
VWDRQPARVVLGVYARWRGQNADFFCAIGCWEAKSLKYWAVYARWRGQNADILRFYARRRLILGGSGVSTRVGSRFEVVLAFLRA